MSELKPNRNTNWFAKRNLNRRGFVAISGLIKSENLSETLYETQRWNIFGRPTDYKNAIGPSQVARLHGRAALRHTKLDTVFNDVVEAGQSLGFDLDPDLSKQPNVQTLELFKGSELRSNFGKKATALAILRGELQFGTKDSQDYYAASPGTVVFASVEQPQKSPFELVAATGSTVALLVAAPSATPSRHSHPHLASVA